MTGGESSIFFFLRVAVKAAQERRRRRLRKSRSQEDGSPVYGDVFYELVGGTVVEDDSSWGHLHSDFLELFPTGLGLDGGGGGCVCVKVQRMNSGTRVTQSLERY